MSKTNDERINDLLQRLDSLTKIGETKETHFSIVKFFLDAESEQNLELINLSLIQFNTVLTDKLLDLSIYLYMTVLRCTSLYRDYLSTWLPLLDIVKLDTSQPPERMKRLLIGMI